MKHIIALLAISLFIISCKTEKPLEEGKYRINGTTIGLNNGEIYLSSYPKMDTIKVINGKFQIEKDLKEVVGQIYIVKDPKINGMDPKTGFNFFVEPTVMDLNLDYDDFSKSKLAGSETQDDQYRLDALTKDIEKAYQKELSAFKAVSEKYQKASAAGASEEALEKIKYEDDACRNQLAPMWEKQAKATLDFIKANPKSFVSVRSLLFQLRDITYKDAKAIVDQFNPEHLKIDLGKELVKNVVAMQKGVPGALAGNFDTVDINGNPVKLADFKGNYLLIDFWASWCIPCRKGNPHLISLYKKYHPKGLEILGVASDDRNHDKWKKAVEKDQIGIWHHVLRGLEYKKDTYEQINIEKDISEGYNIHTLPTKILIDPDGVIIGRYGGGGGTDEDMDSDLAKLFDKKS